MIMDLGALWCNGCSGLFSEAQPRFAGLELSLTSMLRDLGLSADAPSRLPVPNEVEALARGFVDAVHRVV